MKTSDKTVIKRKQSKNNSKIGGEIKAPEETVQWTNVINNKNTRIVKIIGEMKKSEETVMKYPKEFSLKKGVF